MASYAFELEGCSEANLEAVKAAIAAIPGVTSFSITRSAKGAYVLFIESELAEGDLLTALNAALAPLGVRAIGAPHHMPDRPAPGSQGHRPKF